MRHPSRLLFIVALLASRAGAQSPATRSPGAVISGVVRDSIARRPLEGATVQLVSSDSLPRVGLSAVADSLGRYTFGEVPSGRYAIGFFHPVLDSLGVEPTLREVVVAGRAPLRLDLSTPAPDRMRAAICGPQATAGSGLLMGVVRDAKDGTPVSGVSVSGEWLELSFSATGVTRRVPRLVAVTRESGFFALCNVPGGGTMLVVASHDADSTDVVEVQVPAEGFLRRDLYLGHAQTVVTVDSQPRTDSLGPVRRRLRIGDGHLSGIVVTALGGQPLSGARAGISDGPTTLANERGEWTIVNAPVGTRMLEVRAVGYYPERRAVNVIAGAPPIHVALATLKSVLDTVKVTANRLPNRQLAGFEERSHSGPGRYLSAATIAKRGQRFLSDLLRMQPGVRVDRKSDGTLELLVRGGSDQWCKPSIYIDGNYMFDFDADDINDWTTPDRIAGIEIYVGNVAPPQFQPPLNVCGSVVLWSK